MSQKLEKSPGAKADCPICGGHMVCLEKEFQGNKRLSWSNPDGKAHYNFNPETKQTTCNKFEGEPEAPKQNDTLEKYSDEGFLEDCKKLHSIDVTVRAFMQKNNIPPNDQQVGLWTKLIFQKRYGR